MYKEQSIELMAPAGGFDSLMAAAQSGANSVYFGVEQLNMRARATMNFGLDDLAEIAKICQQYQMKSYMTLNTILYDHDISLMKNLCNQAKANGISAVIASDQAVISYARQINLEVHISTQVNITNVETVRFYSLFADVVVLSRELSLLQIKHICDAVEKEQIKGPSGRLIEIEIFAHGALCMAVSGKCYLSLHTQNSSANRGACLQNCRKSYKVIDLEDGHELEIDNEYIMSPKDLCTIDFLDQILASGVRVLKIEGRGKSADYVRTTIACYREAIDSIADGTYSLEKAEAWKTRMEQVYNRGFWGGYYLGQELGEWTDSSGSKAKQKKVYLGKGKHYYSDKKIGEFKLEAQGLKIGDKVLIIGPHSGVIETTIHDLHVEGFGARPAAEKGEVCSFPVDETIRASDKLYKLVAS